jgi:diadenosine tetraphosphate (Ap4A) HIT family hydrolase
MKNLNNICCICKEILTKKFPFEDNYQINTRILHENDDFIVLPSVSPIVTGHLLIFPKRHINNLSQLNDYELNRLFILTNKLYQFFLKKRGEIFIFEHGVANETSTACGINHAHLHLMPLLRENIQNIEQKLQNQFNLSPLLSFERLRHETSLGNQYIFISQDFESYSFAIKGEFESQTLRKIISNELNFIDWNWNNLSGFDKFTETMNLVNFRKVQKVSF